MTTVLAIAVGAAACDNTARGMRDDAEENRAKAAEAQRDATDRAAEAGRDTAAAARDAAGSAAAAVGAATETVDVKSALMADTLVDASDINVDTVAATKTVVLKGSVPTAAQKAEAERIAQREAEGYRVDNQLVVKPRT